MSQQSQFLFEMPPVLEMELEIQPYPELIGREAARSQTCSIGQMHRIVSGWKQYKQRVEELPLNQRSVLMEVGNAIIASFQPGSKPLSIVQVSGHADRDTPRNLEREKKISFERAQQVTLWLKHYVGKRVADKLIWNVRSLGAQQLKFPSTSQQNRQRNRRVEILLPNLVSTSCRYRQPCGVPTSSVQTRMRSQIPLRELESSRRTVFPRLCLFQNASNSSHRNHFQCGADRWARRIRGSVNSFDTGSDIITAIRNLRTQSEQAIEIVHIFSHSGSDGIYGSNPNLGLYFGSLDTQSRQQGARVVTDIPTISLAQNVRFVLHGCNAASGEDNFARALYRHLASTLSEPRVYGHHNSGCCSRDNSWRRYSAQSPNGQNLTTLTPIYQSTGCCDP
jgi:hypothetical protein